MSVSAPSLKAWHPVPVAATMGGLPPTPLPKLFHLFDELLQPCQHHVGVLRFFFFSLGHLTSCDCCLLQETLVPAMSLSALCLHSSLGWPLVRGWLFPCSGQGQASVGGERSAGVDNWDRMCLKGPVTALAVCVRRSLKDVFICWQNSYVVWIRFHICHIFKHTESQLWYEVLFTANVIFRCLLKRRLYKKRVMIAEAKNTFLRFSHHGLNCRWPGIL